MNFPFRNHLHDFKAYSAGKSLFSGDAEIYLDTNENPFENGINRYPSPLHTELRELVCEVKNSQFCASLTKDNILLGNGSDELISLLFTLFCDIDDEVVIHPPTFGMYAVAGAVHMANMLMVEMGEEYNFPIEEIIEKGKNAKMIFLCTPNNPTGNILERDEIEAILKNTSAMVIVDEAYIDFCSEKSVLGFLDKYPHLVVLHTFSKMWGLAGARVGCVMAHPEVIEKMIAIKPPYNINTLSADALRDRLNNKHEVYQQRNEMVSQAQWMKGEYQKLSCVEKVFPSFANFFLIRFTESSKVFDRLMNNGIVVRDFSGKKGTENCLRISIGTCDENMKVLEVLKRI